MQDFRLAWIVIAVFVIAGIFIVLYAGGDAALIAVGAIIGLVGGVIGQLIESELRGKNKRHEILAEREVDACVWIYPLFKKIIQDVDPQNTLANHENAKITIEENNELFWQNLLLLPDEVVKNWIACRDAIHNQKWQLAKSHCNWGMEKISNSLGKKPIK